MSYNQLLAQCIQHGFEKGETLSLGFTRFAVHNGTPDLIMPASRLGLKTYLSYALAEAEWYMHKDRTVDFISQYGPIWKNMTDENGLVNSNYWYQFDTNQTIMPLQEGSNIYRIITEENSRSKYDVPCNNVVDFNLKNGCCNIYVLARSIDLIYGLPFDMFAFQGFARKLGAKTIGRIDFTMIDAHIYKNMLPKLDINKVDDNYLCVQYEDTSYYKELGYIDFREKARNVSTKIEKRGNLFAPDYYHWQTMIYKIEPFDDPDSRRNVNVFGHMISYKSRQKDGFKCYHFLV